MLKLIYLARRKPGFTFDEFVCRWRKHGALGMAQPMWRHALGYVQAEPIRPAPAPWATQEFDAVACFMMRDEMFSEMNDDDAAGAVRMAEDELETFSAPIPTVSLWVKEERVRDGELGGISAYLFFEDAAPAREMSRRVAGDEHLRRIILNLRDDSLLGPEMNTLPYEAVLELSAASVPELLASVASERGELPGGADTAVVTRDAVLWERLARDD